MQACRLQSAADACKYRPEFEDLELRDQLGMIANCLEVTAFVMHECAAKQKRLVEYIEAER
jgi:hypothetical protein